MTKSIFIFFLLVLFIGGGIWLALRKNNNASSKSLGDILSATPTASAAVSPTPQGQVVTLAGGLQVQDLIVGTGATAVAGDLVSVNYIGTLQDGTKFDSSYDRGQAFIFPLGAGKVIAGWDQGVAGMKVGGKRKLIIPGALAYGPQGIPGAIPPNATLIFEVALLDVQGPAGK